MQFVGVRKTGLRVNEARAICFRTRLFCREWQKSIDPRELNSAHLSDITGSRKQRWIYSTAGPPKCPIPSHCLKQVDTVVVRRTVPLSCVVLISYIPACPTAKNSPWNKSRNRLPQYHTACCENNYVNLRGKNICSSLDLVQQAVHYLNQHACDQPYVMCLVSVRKSRGSRAQTGTSLQASIGFSQQINSGWQATFSCSLCLNSQTKRQSIECREHTLQHTLCLLSVISE